MQEGLCVTADMIDECSVEKSMIDRAMLDRIQELLKSLSSQAQDVMCLRMQGFSYYEIAVKLGISENSARVIEFRARARVKQILKEEGFLDGQNIL